MTFNATANPIAYEGGEAVFIDGELDSWNINPAALEAAFVLHLEVKLIVYIHLYGTPGNSDQIRAIAHRHGALIAEDAAEAFGARRRGRPAGSLGNRIIEIIHRCFE